ncbi:2-succinyl-5-enolpyruvyl-6-hydroxy-3-cyclohexene-1-carboxylic-acid synthase [Pleurocapsales cyanobacterium LEGE 06147]|nr:2-succinyl-5-enolpyruvyl-6-hydroxy-3-cyclohexene-1-carboxylic-acid synthase [Pleurocapsales cyanobacterium LEGE 06147]
MIDFRNLNILWSSILVETLQRLGLATAIICPGSRSTPLTIAFAQHQAIETIPILDERSAAFFALGIAKKSGLPVVLVCTSGTAGANFYPAVIEAKESSVPLIILTADRPPQLRNCHAGQTIDQVKLYGNYPNWQAELALPKADIGMLRYLRQNIIHAWERSLFPVKGVVHLNLPFQEPLAPTPQPEVEVIKSQFPIKDFFAHIPNSYPFTLPSSSLSFPFQQWQSSPRGIIIAGLAQPAKPEQYCRAIAYLSETLQFPVLAEALSPIRNYADLNPYLISTYDCILRNERLASQLTPDVVIQVGELPTSKQLRSWLEQTQCQRWIISPHPDNFDSLNGNSVHLRTSIEELIDRISAYCQKETNSSNFPVDYLQKWCEADKQIRKAIDKTMETLEVFYDGKAAWLLSRSLPPQTPIFIANSMSVRNVEFFWQPNNSKVIPYFNRGANGIDGTLSTALGIAHRHQSAVILTGDLALLHDTNGFLIGKKFQGHLTIILINNNGGGIFEALPIAEFDPPFEECFATPQQIDYGKLCATYGVEYKLIDNWAWFEDLLSTLPTIGIRVLEIPTNRKTDTLWLQNNLPIFARNIILS